jgi:hypothetical protein
MFDGHLPNVVRSSAIVLLTIALAAGLLRAESVKFNQAREALYNQSLVKQKELGVKPAELYTKYPCPEIQLTKVLDVKPGATTSVTANGKFPPGTVFLSDLDGAALAGTATSTTYSGRLTVAAGLLPTFVHLYAFNPVSMGYTFVPVAFINSVYRFDLKGANGWNVKAIPTAPGFKLSDGSAALPYRVEFYRANESKPFETLNGTLNYSAGAPASSEISVNLQPGAGNAQAEVEELTRKMSDTQAFLKLPEQEQNALFERITALSDQMVKDMTAQMAVDPAVRQKQQDDFGCSQLTLQSAPAGAVSGRVSCGRNVATKGILNVTGTLAVSQ